MLWDFALRERGREVGGLTQEPIGTRLVRCALITGTVDGSVS